MWYMWLIIGVILIAQCYLFFFKTYPGIMHFKGIFPSNDADDYAQLRKGNWLNENNTMEIWIDNKASKTILAIRKAINRYLKENSSRTSDYALLKDIVERNCDAIEDDTRELIPLPLYLGLAGTMIGIAIGVGTLDLNQLFTATGNAVSINAISPLLKDVSLAMVCSFFGLVFTTASTFMMRSSKTKVESDKHNFLSWIQAKLLPEMPDNMSSVIMRMTGDLSKFNQAFEKNAEKLKNTLDSVADASAQNTRLLAAVNDLKQVQVSQVNLQLYERLAHATREIGILAEYLSNCRSYLNQVKALNDKIDASEERMHAIEEMGKYFKSEKAQIVHVSKLTQDTIGQADEEIRKSVKQFGENIDKYFVAMQETLQKQNLNLERVMAEQQQSLVKKANELTQVIGELRNMSDVKQTMKQLLDAYREQNRLLTTAVNQRGHDATPLPSEQPRAKLPIWLSVVVISVAFFITIAVIFYVLQSFHLFNP